jgi:hypothetical protein
MVTPILCKMENNIAGNADLTHDQRKREEKGQWREGRRASKKMRPDYQRSINNFILSSRQTKGMNSSIKK